MSPGWSNTPPKQIIAAPPFSEKEILKVEQEITGSYKKNGSSVSKVKLQKISDYELFGSITLLKNQNTSNTPLASNDIKCTANKSLDGSIHWACDPSLSSP